MKFILSLIMTLLSLSAAAWAAGDPVELSAKDSIAWRKTEQAYVATGDAEAVRGDASLHADSLVAKYRETDAGGTEVYEVTARESASIRNKDMTGTAGQILYHADDGTVVMTGAPLALDGQQAHMTASRSITMHDDPRRVDLDGNARILRKTDNTVMTADRMTAHFTRGANGQDELGDIHATGHVTLVSDKLASLSDEVTYNAATDDAILSGHVRITREDSQLGGDKAIINLTSGDSRILAEEKAGSGRVRALFLPDGNQQEANP